MAKAYAVHFALIGLLAGCSAGGPTSNAPAANASRLEAVTLIPRVYKGCDPKCTLLGGPFALSGNTIFGHLNERSTEFVGADYQYGEIDVYKYAPTRLTYLYSFNNGLDAGDDVEGAAFNPG